MHKLTRHVRFSVSPFLREQDEPGANPFAGEPAGQGLAIFLELAVTLLGPVDEDSGFVVNVFDIDRRVRADIVPIFAARIRGALHNREHLSLSLVVQLLSLAAAKLQQTFCPDDSLQSTGHLAAEIRFDNLCLKLNPFTRLTVYPGESEMIYFSEKFEFAATHTLWNNKFSDRQNREIFGKCANPTGHGHNYVLEVTVRLPGDYADSFATGRFEKTIDTELVALLDHKNLNTDLPELARTIPTVENLATFAWNRLSSKFESGKLHCVTIWETDRTACSYFGQ